MSLERLPFENIPDPKYVFDQDYYRRLLGRMMDSLWVGRSLMVVAGPIIGKTIFTQRLIASVPEKTRIIRLGEQPDTGDELLLFLTQELLHISLNRPAEFLF